MVVLNCCRCQEGTHMDTAIYGSCYSCNHVFCEFCPEDKSGKPGCALALDQTLSISNFASDFSLSNMSASSSNHGPHGSYHIGYDNGYHHHK